MKKYSGFVLLPIILIVTLIILIIVIFFNISQKQDLRKSNNNVSTNLEVKEEKLLSLSGMVWTSGLMDSEKEVLDISTDYQIVKSLLSKGWNENTDGMFLISNGIDFKQYVGKCVTINGEISDGWNRLEKNNYEINGKWTYNRSAIVVQEIIEEDLGQCISDYDRTVKDKVIIENSKHESVRGILEFAKRPAPDIGYDFVIIPNEPFVDEQSAAGYPVEINKLDINPGTDEIFTQLTENIGKEAEVGGYMVWGYSESRYLVVDKLQIKY
jgi:hypothetical protein